MNDKNQVDDRFCLAGNRGAVAAETPAIIPQPTELILKDGAFELAATTRLQFGTPAAAETARQLAAMLAPATGFHLIPTAHGANTAAIQPAILLTTAGADATLGEEGYDLSVTPATVQLRATTSAGLFYGCQTLLQLMPSALFAETVQAGTKWRLPAVTIRDAPRYRWRGLMLDCSRHFMPVPFVKRFIELLAMHKMNRFHWHLTDDQGWRIEIKKYPELTRRGAIRTESPRPGNRDRGDGEPYGPFFYTQEQIREIVDYATERHVVVVPEIEMPGHALAALAAYPELSCTGGSFRPRTKWGVEPDVYCAGKDQVLQFNRDVLTEVLAMFPSPFIHIGGDECPKERWKECPHCQARMTAHGLKDTHELQSWFIKQIDQFLAANGRRLIGWDEILEGGLAPGAAVMSWRGVHGGVAAAAAGHDVVMSPSSHCYFDYGQSGAVGEPECFCGHLPLATVYSYEPTPVELTVTQRPYVIGVQGNIWTEYLWKPAHVEYAAYPRACALAEVAWTAAARREFGDFWRRMQLHGQRLDARRVQWRRLSDDQR